MEMGIEEDSEGSPATPPRLLAALTAALERLIRRNEALTEAITVGEGRGCHYLSFGGNLDLFRAARVPSISVGRYLERLYQYAECSPSCFVLGFAYIDRLAHRHPFAFLVSLNVHRLILTSVMVASKVLDDVHHSNAFYSKVGGVSMEELNRLELELLFLLDFDVAVGSRVFEGYCLHLEKEMMLQNGGVMGDGWRRRRDLTEITGSSNVRGEKEEVSTGSGRSSASPYLSL
ncbi:cyclin-U1-1-like [Wolffia australiana]